MERTESWSTASELYFLRNMRSIKARINYYGTCLVRHNWGTMDKAKIITEARKESFRAEKELKQVKGEKNNER